MLQVFLSLILFVPAEKKKKSWEANGVIKRGLRELMEDSVQREGSGEWGGEGVAGRVS